MRKGEVMILCNSDSRRSNSINGLKEHYCLEIRLLNANFNNV